MLKIAADEEFRIPHTVMGIWTEFFVKDIRRHFSQSWGFEPAVIDS